MYKIFCLILLISIVLTSITCQNPLESEDDTGFCGQLETDIDYAIIKPDGTIWTWGENSTGQLGNGTMNPSETPNQIRTLAGMVTIDLAEGAAYAADSAGNIWFWGNRLIWEEPPGYDTTIVTPTKISYLSGTKQMIVGGPSVYLLRKDGTVWRLVWDHFYPTKYLYPEKIVGIDDIRIISGDLALGNDGIVYERPSRAWIGPENGGLGEHTISYVINIQNAPMRYTIILKGDSTVWAWGKNKCGNLGSGTYNDNPNPSKIDTLTDVISLSANGSRCLALGNDGLVWFWGMIDVDLDQGIQIYQNKPIIIEELNGIKMIHASAARRLLFMKRNYSYWSYDVKTRKLEKLQL